MISLTAVVRNFLVIGQDLPEWPVRFATMPVTGKTAYCHTVDVNGVSVRYFSDLQQEADLIVSVKELGLGLTHLLLCAELNKSFPDNPPAALFTRGADLLLKLQLNGLVFEVHLLMHHNAEALEHKLRVCSFEKMTPLLMINRDSAADQLQLPALFDQPVMRWSTTAEAVSKLKAFIGGKIQRYEVRNVLKKTQFRPVFFRTRCSCCNSVYLVPVAMTLLANRSIPNMSPISFHVGLCRRSYVADHLSMFDRALHSEARRYGLPLAIMSGAYLSPDGRYMRDSACPNCKADINGPIEPPPGVVLKQCPSEIAPSYVDASFLVPNSNVWSEPTFSEETLVSAAEWKAIFVEPVKASFGRTSAKPGEISDGSRRSGDSGSGDKTTPHQNSSHQASPFLCAYHH